jgi:hypothetical protein
MERVAMMHYVNIFLRYCERLDHQGWFLLGLAVVGLGLICMKGFGSRSNY